MIYILGKILNEQLRFSLESLNIYYYEIDNINQINFEEYKQVIILKNNVCIKKSFLKDINKILDINENSIIGYNNSNKLDYNKYNNEELLINLNDNIISNSYKLDLNICALSINTQKLNNYNINIFCKLTEYINPIFITKTSYFNSINKKTKYYNYPEKNEFIFGKLGNNDNLKLINNNIINYHNSLNKIKDIEHRFYPNYIENIFINDLHFCNLSSIIIKNNNLDSIERLIKNISEITLNNIFNRLIFLIDLKNKEDIIKILKKYEIQIMNRKFLDENINNISELICNVPYFYNIYLLNNEKFIINNNKDIDFNINIENNKLYLYTFPKFIIDLFNLNNKINDLFNEKDGFNKIKNYLSNIAVKYFSNNTLYNSNKNKKDLIIDHDIKLEINNDFLIFLYDEKDWDLISSLLSFILKSKIEYNDNLLIKIISILPYCNNEYSYITIKNIILAHEIDNFNELINICYILIGNNKFSILEIILEKYLLIFSNEEDNILGLLYLINESFIFEGEIDITSDTKYLTFLLDNFEYIEENLNKIVLYNKLLDPDKIMNNILLYLLPRNDLIENISKNFYIKINKIYKKFFNINFQILDEKFSDKIINFFNLSPMNSMSYFLSISEVMLTTEDILLKRKNAYLFFKILNKNIDKLNLDNISNIEQKLLKIISVFKYSYHGISNKKLFLEIFNFAKYLLEKILKSKKLDIDNLHYLNKEDLFNYKFENTNKKKIIFISDFLTRKHSVFKDRHQVICNLAKKNFDIYIGHYSDLDYNYSNIYKDVKKIKLIGSLLEDVNNLRKENFDKVVFCEIGMDCKARMLSLFKLGRVHYNTWGHSDTSGTEFTDYFVSSKLYELDYEEAQDNYTEKLILQNGMCTCYVNPSKGKILNKPRTYYGLSKNEFIILCPQSLFKIYPDYDEYIFEILLQNPSVTVVFIDALNKKFKMYERWDNKIDKKYFGVLSRVKFIGGLSHTDFVNLIKLSDLMIDPYPFGGCNTSLESFSVGTPVVTQPSRMINGRFTHGFYKKMGFLDLVANSKEEYISITSRLINDKDFYEDCVDKINKNSDILFEDQETLDEWEELMSQ